METLGIDHVNLGYPADRLEAVIGFYVDTLGFETDFDNPHEAVRNEPGLFAVHLDESSKLYVNPVDDFDAAAMNFRHVAVRIPRSPADLLAFLETENIEIGHTAEREHPEFGPYTSYYVEDPVGYTVEFMAVDK